MLLVIQISIVQTREAAASKPSGGIAIRLTRLQTLGGPDSLQKTNWSNQMPDFKTKMHKTGWGSALRQAPLGSLQRSPRPNISLSGGLILRKGRLEGKKTLGFREGRGKKGKGGKQRKGRRGRAKCKTSGPQGSQSGIRPWKQASKH